jgi:hypothetical protein
MPKATGGSSNPDISSSKILTFKHKDGRLKLLPPSASSTIIQQIKFPESAGTADQSLKIKTDGISTDPDESNRKIVLTEWGGGGGGGGNANTITLANETGNDERFIVFSNTSAPSSGTSSVSLKTNSTLKFNSSTNVLSTTTFNGNLTGTATTATNLSSTLTIAQGGTNATSASTARTALGVDAAGTDNSTNVMLSSVAGNYLTLDEDNQILTAGVVPISLGGTGATSASTARTALGVDAAGTDNSTNVMLSSVAGNYLTLDEDNQILTAGVVPISLGGTSSNNVTDARTALGVDAAGTDNSTNVMLSSVAGNYLTLDEDNQILTADVVPISLGGTGSTSASAARSALGVDAAGTDNSTNVMLSSVAGNYLTLDEDNQILTADVVPRSLGGTDATSASAARTALDAQILLTDGEFTSGHKTKLNNIETSADTTSFTDVVNVGGLMTFNNTKPITGDIVIGEDDNDLMVVNSNIISNGYIKKPTRFKPKTTIVGTPFTLNFGTALDTITHLDGTSSAIDTRVYLDDIKDINKVLVMGKIHIGYSVWNIFASVLLIKRLYDSSGNVITSEGDSGNIEVGSGSDNISNTTDSFFDASIAITPGDPGFFIVVLNNLGGHFLDTNPTEGISGVSKISYHYAIKPLHNENNAIKVGQPWNIDDENRCSAATMLTLFPFCS